MHRGKSFVAVIPARGGSKGIKNKNIRNLCGKPLIWYCIDAAIKSGIFDFIVVTSDSREILKVVYKYFPDVAKVKRPPELAEDNTPTEPVISHALKSIFLGVETHDYVQLIEPTSPLVEPQDFVRAANFLIDNNCDLVLGVSKTGFQHIFPLGLNGSLKDCYPVELRRKGRQYTPKMYYLNGCIYVGKWDIFYNEKDFYECDVRAFEIPEEKAVDINYLPDLHEAAKILRSRRWKKLKAGLKVVKRLVKGR